MRRFAITFVVVPILLLLTLTACGGGGSSAVSTTVASITLSPTAVSMNKGDVQQLTATALDANKGTVAADFTYTSSNASLLTISNSGLICAGTWDSLTTPVVCTPATASGTADVSVKAQSVTATETAFVHDKVDIVEVDAVPACVSMGETTQLTASSFSTNPAVCSALTPAATPPCKLPASTVGPYTWVSADTKVVTIDNTVTTNGTATAAAPGQTPFFASNANNHSSTKTFTTCPITSISITQNSTTTPFTYNKAETKTLTAVVKDSAGKTLDGTKQNSSSVIVNAPPITWVSAQPFVTSMVAASPTTGTATASNPGTGLLVAACVPTTCNINLPPVFSNPIIGTVSGTANATIYAASTTSTTLIPIDSATNTAGTAITLPRTPNSMVMNTLGTKLLLGADSGGLMLVDAAAGTVSTPTASFGRVIGFSPDGIHALVYDAVHNSVLGFNVNTGSTDVTINVTGAATSGDVTPDGSIYFVTAGGRLYSFNGNEGQRSVPLPGTANEISILASGPAVYTPITSGSIQARATCQPATVVDTQVATAPTNVKTLPDGSGAVVVDSPNLIVLNNANVGGVCPITLSESRTAVDLQGGAFKPNQLLVTPDATLAFVTNDTGKLLTYNINSGAVKPITLAASATASFTMGSTLDSKFVYVGASDGTVHKIDTTTMTDAQQIAVGLKKSDGSAAVPDLVAVRNKS